MSRSESYKGPRCTSRRHHEQQALRKELRAYFAELLTPEVRAEIGHRGEGGDGWRRIVRQMGTDGWLGIGWPKEYGGQGRPATDQFIFFDEVQRAERPVPVRDAQHRRPDAHAATAPRSRRRTSCPGSWPARSTSPSATPSPSAGTDLASLQTRAVRDGDEYVINGNKIFTSGANDADYVWLACRTDPDVAEAQGHLDHPRADRRRRASRGRRSSPSAATGPPPPTTTTCGCRSATSSARRTAAGS